MRSLTEYVCVMCVMNEPIDGAGMCVKGRSKRRCLGLGISPLDSAEHATPRPSFSDKQGMRGKTSRET